MNEQQNNGDLLNIASILLVLQNLQENREQTKQNNVQTANDKQAKLLIDEMNTNEQIIKALDYCSTKACSQCPAYDEDIECGENTIKVALDLINRQKAEIEGLEETRYELVCIIDELREERERLLQKLQQAKSEAIKEFAERLKETAYSYSDISGYSSTVVDADGIDNLVKEMEKKQC